MGLIAGIPPYQERVDCSQRAFPKRVQPGSALSVVQLCLFDLLRHLRPVISNRAMAEVNRTLLLPLLSKCQQILEDRSKAERVNATVSSSTAAPPFSTVPGDISFSSFRETYDNAYFYILFVMVFYSFLAMALFKCVGSDEDKKDPYEEFLKTGQPSAQKVDAGRMAEKFYFEEESSL